MGVSNIDVAKKKQDTFDLPAPFAERDPETLRIQLWFLYSAGMYASANNTGTIAPTGTIPSAHQPHWLIPFVASDFTGSIAGRQELLINRHYGGTTTVIKPNKRQAKVHGLDWVGLG